MNTVNIASASIQPVLEIRGLCKDFTGRGRWGGCIRAVDNADMEVYPAEIRGIVGESGSGKTTLARCSLRLLEPSAGSVLMDGEDMANLSSASLRARRLQFQMIFQDSFASLNPLETVEEILLEPLQIHKIGGREYRDRKIRELLDSVSLNASFLRRRPGELSGGEQQRVGIARGLALNPRLLVADEPTSSLDASVQAQILSLLSDLQKRYAFALILISHSLAAVHYLCSRIAVMFQGRIVEDAPAASFFRGPRHPYSEMLLNSMPVMDPSGQAKAGSSGRGLFGSSAGGAGCAFHPYCSHAQTACRQQVPVLREVQPGEKVACFLFF